MVSYGFGEVTAKFVLQKIVEMIPVLDIQKLKQLFMDLMDVITF